MSFAAEKDYRAIAAAGTYGIGKSAEAYFFSGERRKPSDFADDWDSTEK